MFESFTVIPAIDLKDGQVVRLVRGAMDQATIYGADPAAVAHRFEQEGARLIHVVDLDGAIAGEPRNLAAMRAIRAAVRCDLDFSGGLRSIEAIGQAFDAGADWISIGTAAFLTPALLAEACAAMPGRVFGSIDLREGKPAIRGWVETVALTLTEAAKRLRDAGVAAVIVTDVARDGTEAGVDVEGVRAAATAAGMPMIASGGLASLADVIKLKALFTEGVVGAISGRALYEGRFTLAEAIGAAR